MAKRNDSPIGSVIALILGSGFLLFWIGMSSRHGAPAFFPLFGVVFLGILVVTLGGSIIKTLGEQGRNQAAPVLSAEAHVVTKRAEVRSRGKSHATDYYATFGLDSGARVEFELSGEEYGLLAEGDRGELRYQGTWFLGFNRQASSAPPPEIAAGPHLRCEYCGAVNPPGTHKCTSCGSGKLVAREETA